MNRRRFFRLLPSAAAVAVVPTAAFAGLDWKAAPLELMVDPILRNEPASILPGMITFVNNGSGGFKPAFEVSAWALKHIRPGGR